MEEAIEILQEMIDELESKCPKDYSSDNNYTEIRDKIDLLYEAINNIKRKMN